MDGKVYKALQYFVVSTYGFIFKRKSTQDFYLETFSVRL